MLTQKSLAFSGGSFTEVLVNFRNCLPAVKSKTKEENRGAEEKPTGTFDLDNKRPKQFTNTNVILYINSKCLDFPVH